MVSHREHFQPSALDMPDFPPDEVLSVQQFADVRQGFAKLSPSSLQQAYSEALERCKLGRRGRAPNSIHIQVLVQAWRELRTVG